MVHLSILHLFFQKLRPFSSASRTDTEFGSSSASRLKTEFGSGYSCGSCFEPGFRYRTRRRLFDFFQAFWISYLGHHNRIESTTVSESHRLSSSNFDRSSGHLALATQIEIGFEYSEHAQCLHFS